MASVHHTDQSIDQNEEVESSINELLNSDSLGSDNDESSDDPDVVKPEELTEIAAV